MQDILEILKYVLPSLIVFGTAYYLIKMMLNKDANKLKMEVALEHKKVTLPIRLRAYERMSLFLERIAFDSLIVRIAKPEMTVGQLQVLLISNIRKEYEHNMSQQIYVSNSTWQAIKMAKENSIKLVNSVADSIDRKAPAMELGKGILSAIMKLENSPTDLALSILKNEIRAIF